MKLSSAFHWVGRIVGTLGGLALVGAWVAGESGRVFGLSQTHLFFDSIALSLLSIAGLICGLFYLRLEETGQKYY